MFSSGGHRGSATLHFLIFLKREAPKLTKTIMKINKKVKQKL